MQTKTTFTFSFKVGERDYSFNEIADTKEEALSILLGDLKVILDELASGS